MREEGILYARCGELELRLGVKPPSSTVRVDSPIPADATVLGDETAALSPPRHEEDAPEADEDDFAALLHSSGVDPAAIRALTNRSRSTAKVI